MSVSRLTSFRPYLAGLLLVVLSASRDARADDPPNPWAFKNDDRIVFVGDTFIERDQRYGYLETMLTLANPDRDLTFRNLGWSGDTVRGLSRAGFDPPEAGFQALKEQVLAAKPTVLVVGYGMAESFDGEAGLSRFVEGYNAFLDAVASAGARLVLLSPLPHEALPAPLPDPTSHNRDLKIYADAVRAIAKERNAAFIDLYQDFETLRGRRKAESAEAGYDTDNGIHLTAIGYWRLATLPGVKPASNPVSASKPSKGTFGSHHITETEVSPNGLKFVTEDPQLPTPPAPSVEPEAASRKLRVVKLAPGRYGLKIDGEPVLARTAEEWAEGVVLPSGPELAQVEELRKTINEKNLLFFYRWRPQNITYLFGFRKHEQGNNAVEIPQFDPLIDAKEKEIARLRKPVVHTYELIRENEVSR